MHKLKCLLPISWVSSVIITHHSRFGHVSFNCCEIYSSGLLPQPHEPLQSHTNGSVESVAVDEEGDDVDVPTLVGCKSEREDALYVVQNVESCDYLDNFADGKGRSRHDIYEPNTTNHRLAVLSTSAPAGNEFRQMIAALYLSSHCTLQISVDA